MVQAGGGCADLEEESVVENVAEVLAINKLSDFELARNKRIAEMYAEFYKQYPELNVDERRKKRSSMILYLYLKEIVFNKYIICSFQFTTCTVSVINNVVTVTKYPGLRLGQGHLTTPSREALIPGKPREVQ